MSYASEYYGGGGVVTGADSELIDAELFIGDDYLATNDRALEWTVDIPLGTTIAGSTCELRFVQASGVGSPLEVFVDGTITAGETGQATLSFDLPHSLTEAIVASEYRWFVTWTGDAGELITQIFNRQLVNWKNKGI